MTLVSQASYAVLTAACELLVYFIMGGVVPFAARGEQKSFAETVCAGYIVTTVLVEILCLIGIRQGLSLTLFSYLAATVLCIFMASSIVLNFPSVFRGTSAASGGIRFSFLLFLAFLLASGCAFLAAVLPSSGDPGMTIARMTSDLYSDTIGLRAPGSGRTVTAVAVPDFFSKYYMFDTLVCKITGLHPMTEMKVVRAAVTSILSSMAAYRIFFRIFDRSVPKAACGLMLALTAGLFFRTPYTPSGMLYSQGWTGQAAFASVLLPVLILTVLVLLDNPANGRAAALLILSGTAAVSLTFIGAVIWLFAVAACVLPVCAASKKPVLLLLIPASAIIPAAVIIMDLNLNLIPVA